MSFPPEILREAAPAEAERRGSPRGNWVSDSWERIMMDESEEESEQNQVAFRSGDGGEGDDGGDGDARSGAR